MYDTVVDVKMQVASEKRQIKPSKQCAKCQLFTKAFSKVALRKCAACNHASTYNDVSQLPSTRALDVHRPTCAESLFRAQVAQCIDDLQLNCCWFAFIPSYLGWDPIVDLAADTFRLSQLFFAHGCSNALSYEAGSKSYGRALKQVQARLNTPGKRHLDSTILAIALLTPCELMLFGNREAYHAHFAGISSLMLARKNVKQTSELVRAIFFSMWDNNFRVPCSTGDVSPFDGTDWEQLQPAFSRTAHTAIYQLRRLAQQLLIRLPKMIVLVRALREASCVGDETLAELASLFVSVLEKYQDLEAESTLLHRVKIITTPDPTDYEVIHQSFRFNAGTEELTTGVLYWQARLMLINLYYEISSLAKVHDLQHLLPKSKYTQSTLEAEQRRLITNILMSWTDARSRGNFGTIYFPQAFLALWLLLPQWHCDREDRGLAKRVTVLQVQHWVLMRFGWALCGSGFKTTMTTEDAMYQMDLAGEQLIGGPVHDLWKFNIQE